MLVPKCIYPKSIFAKCTRLARLLSFASLLIIPPTIFTQLHPKQNLKRVGSTKSCAFHAKNSEMKPIVGNKHNICSEDLSIPPPSIGVHRPDKN